MRWSLLLLVGCAPLSEGAQWGAPSWETLLETYDAGDGFTHPPPIAPVVPALKATPLVAGAPWTLSLSGVQPGTAVYIALSPGGPGAGPCLPVGLGGCLGVREPVMHLGTATADALGEARLMVTAPATLSKRYAVQALLAPANGEAWFTTGVVEVAP